MKQRNILCLFLSGLLLFVSTIVIASGQHEHDKERQHDDDQSTQIDKEMASNVGIETAIASSNIVNRSVIVYGSLATGPEQLSHVRARYSGLIKSVKKSIGDRVNRGDLLAKIESNESLNNYTVKAPISGTVIQRHANTGEVTQDQILFSIANFETLWAEFRIYPSQQTKVRDGQVVLIEANGFELNGTISHVIPVLDKPFLLARVKINNQSSNLTPGLLVEGRIIIEQFQAELTVEKQALQTLGGKIGVFTKAGDEYHFVPLMLGRSDNHFVEVLSGVSEGQEYVSTNSYLIKADIEKSEAEHEH
ncbi:efflux RND transporter periplasmic adaptor subunit [Pleionea litopenaei]|uniref:HlyD family efflux transporter periplasmic adaptor subunit n=1 Tax=Pleionea litopenaei TaxID=3070815 RepID=A0AA51RUM4_9GAMM|nr:HlyD family efflux transporter periplasmic adaptor subunit [Pleionea sp. HL-JVS1]WMS87885.1 HlyD family efflux transporter periplasmic adaptor subunit [Pleionea sp. HL-JVS1]